MKLTFLLAFLTIGNIHTVKAGYCEDKLSKVITDVLQVGIVTGKVSGMSDTYVGLIDQLEADYSLPSSVRSGFLAGLKSELPTIARELRSAEGRIEMSINRAMDDLQTFLDVCK